MNAASASDTTTEPETTVPENVPSGIDPQSMLRPKMRVLGDAGRPLGQIDSLEYDAADGYLNSLVVRHGIFGREHTSIPADRVTQINEDSVVLALSLEDFRTLPTVEGR